MTPERCNRTLRRRTNGRQVSPPAHTATARVVLLGAWLLALAYPSLLAAQASANGEDSGTVFGASGVIALCALIVSVVAVTVNVVTELRGRRHDRLSVRPVVQINEQSYLDRVCVTLENRGLGPLRIRSARFDDGAGRITESLIEHMPSGRTWRDFWGRIDGDYVQAGAVLELVLLEGSPSDDEFCAYRDQVRQHLGRITVRVQYEDLYGCLMQPVVYPLEWFRR
jgi:hypothetical protein